MNLRWIKPVSMTPLRTPQPAITAATDQACIEAEALVDRTRWQPPPPAPKPAPEPLTAAERDELAALDVLITASSNAPPAPLLPITADERKELARLDALRGGPPEEQPDGVNAHQSYRHFILSERLRMEEQR